MDLVTLTPPAAARLILAYLRMAGGVGSGNFGHEGRPGFEGGSALAGAWLIESFGTTTEPGLTKFVLADGTRIKGKRTFEENGASHEDMVGGRRALARLLDKGVMRYEPASGGMTAAVPTYEQAQLLADDWMDRDLYVDYFPEEGRSSHANLGQAPTAERIRNWFKKAHETKLRALGGRGSGNFGHAGRKGLPGGSASSDRAARAIATHKPMTKEKWKIATRSVRQLSRYLGGEMTDNNRPMDVVVETAQGLQGIEVKTVLTNTTNQITMHPESLARKVKWVRANRAQGHTIIVDRRQTPPVYYHREGFGSFRLDTMAPVPLSEIRTRILGELKAAGGPGSGNFGHAGRPGKEGGSAAATVFGMPAASTDPAPGKNFYYHATPATNLESIAVLGLEEQDGEYVSAVPSLDAAHTWVGLVEGDKGATALLRIKRSDVINPQFDASYDANDPGAEMAFKFVDPFSIEVFANGSWQSITDDEGNFVTLGGKGSGNYGHAGRPGVEGGSTAKSVEYKFTNRTPEARQHIRSRRDFDGYQEVWKGPGGIPVKVNIDYRIMPEAENVAKRALAAMPPQVLRSASYKGEPPTIELVTEIPIAHSYASQKEPNWNAAGLYNKSSNTIQLNMRMSGTEQTLAHELGHGLMARSLKNFGRREVRDAYKADRHDLVKAKGPAYKEFAYFRSNVREAFAESVASELAIAKVGRPGQRQVFADQEWRALRYRGAFPRTAKVVEAGLKKILARPK